MPRIPGMYFDRTLETLDDAVFSLRKRCSYFAQHRGALVHVMVIGLPDGSELPLVALVGPLNADRKKWAVGIACADRFVARTALKPDRQSYIIDELHEACVDQDANVTLSSGQHIFDVRLMARPRPTDLTDAERVAVRAIISCETGSLYVDYGNLPDLSDVPLKKLKERIERHRDRDSTVPVLSWEVYRSALVKTGIRRVSRRRQL